MVGRTMSGLFSTFTGRGAVAAQAAYDAAKGRARSRKDCPPDMLGGLSSYSTYFGNAYSSATVSVSGALFFFSLIVFVIFLILIFIHYTFFPVFALSVNDPGFIPVPTSTDRELSFKKSSLATPSTRRDTDNGLQTITTGTPPVTLNKTSLPSCGSYTIAADVFIDGGLKPIAYPNVILYRDIADNSDTLAEAPNAVASTLHETYARTNILAWLDPHTNDLQITVVAIDIGGQQRLQSLQPPIQNVPLNKYFRLAIVLADSFVEIYINGGLERSMQINGNLKQIGDSTTSTDFYPPITDPSIGGVKMGNMSMWPRVITSKEIRAYEAAPMTS